MANIITTNIFCRNQRELETLYALLKGSAKVAIEQVIPESCLVSIQSKWDAPLEELKTISESVDFDFYIEYAGETVMDGTGEAVYRNGGVIDGFDCYDVDSLDAAKVFLRVNGQDYHRYDKTSGDIVYVDDYPDLAVIDTTSEVLERFLSKVKMHDIKEEN